MARKRNKKIGLITKFCTLVALACLSGCRSFSTDTKCTGIIRRLSDKCGVTENGGVCCDGTAVSRSDKDRGDGSICPSCCQTGCFHAWCGRPQCQDSSTGICKLPAKPGPCKAAFPRYYLDQNSGKCQKFTYGGCDGNGNNFKTREACEIKCGGTFCTQAHERCSRKGPSCCGGLKCTRGKGGWMCRNETMNTRCGKPCLRNGKADDGMCRYNQYCRSDKTMCGGTCENFKPCKCGESCKINHGGIPWHGTCQVDGTCSNLRDVPPNCPSDVKKTILPFTCKCGELCKVDDFHGECQADGRTCAQNIASPNCSSDICKLPAKIGHCHAAIPRYHFDQASGKCQHFIYGGCDGNGNNFKTKEACKKKCVVKGPAIPTNRQLGETCGSCFCPPTYTAGECAPHLYCKPGPQSLPDAAGTCEILEI